MITTPFIRDCIVDKEKTHLIAGRHRRRATSQYGMQTFDQSIFAPVSSSRLVSVRRSAALGRRNVDEFKLRLQGIYAAERSRVRSPPRPRPAVTPLRSSSIRASGIDVATPARLAAPEPMLPGRARLTAITQLARRDYTRTGDPKTRLVDAAAPRDDRRSTIAALMADGAIDDRTGAARTCARPRGQRPRPASHRRELAARGIDKPSSATRSPSDARDESRPFARILIQARCRHDAGRGHCRRRLFQRLFRAASGRGDSQGPRPRDEKRLTVVATGRSPCIGLLKNRRVEIQSRADLQRDPGVLSRRSSRARPPRRAQSPRSSLATIRRCSSPTPG